MHKKRKQPKVTTKEKNYRFWNCGVEYICNVIAPVSIPDYRLKEVFNRTFVGKKDMSVVTSPITNFRALHKDIDYTIKPVKEIV